MTTTEFVALLFLCAVASGILTRVSRKLRSTQRKSNSPKKRPPRTGGMKPGRRPDDKILKLPINELKWSEFEHLLALYFRDQGYEVEETGVGGNDGGVDLVLLDKRTNERTAVQVKWRSRAAIGPNIVRELNTARRNTKPTCLYATLITNSDITQRAMDEAYKLHMECWNGPRLQFKLEKWDRWTPPKRSRRNRGASAVR